MTKGEDVKYILLETVHLTDDLGLNVRVIACEKGSNNRVAYRLKDASLDNPYIEHNEIKKCTTNGKGLRLVCDVR